MQVWKHPDRLLAGAEGNLQELPNGNVVASFGPEERVSEFGRDGRLLLDLALPAGADTYQAFRFPWRGRPLDRPAVAARRRGERRTTVWASWNGATLVRRWRVLAGARARRAETDRQTGPADRLRDGAQSPHAGALRRRPRDRAERQTAAQLARDPAAPAVSAHTLSRR